MEQAVGEMERLQEEIGSLFPTLSVDLDELFHMILQGKISDVIKILMQHTMQSVSAEIGSFGRLAVMLLGIALLAALLMNLTSMFENRQLGDIGFYFVYLFLMLVLLRVFAVVTGSAQDVLEEILLFMKLFLPVYFLAVGAAAGVTTALFYYQFVLILIYGMELLLNTFLLPLIKVYLFLAFMNGLWKEERLGMVLALIRRFTGDVMKILFAVITGISLIHSMITPVIDSARFSAIQKAVSMIPGIGNVGSTAAEMVLGSAVLVKNSVGVLAILLMIGLCIVPVFKIWLFAMLLKGVAAVSGVLGDKRIAACTDHAGEGSFLVLRVLLTACGLFLITIAVAAMTTNRGF